MAATRLPDRLLTTAEVAGLIGMSSYTVTHYARTGRIRAVRTGKPGAQLRYRPADVQAYLDSLSAANQ